MYTCPICGYNQMARAPEDYAICPSCGTEFWVDDVEYTHDELRARWVRSGYPWHSHVVPSPRNWNPRKQLERVLKPVPILEGISIVETNFSVDQVAFLIDRSPFLRDGERLVRATSGSLAKMDVSYTAV